MSYSRTIQVEFNHCDPAGIVFYPRYFEMTNSVVENFFADRVGRSYARITMQDGNGVPTVKIDAAFRAPSRLGDRLVFTLRVLKVGGSSVGFHLAARGEGEPSGSVRMEADMTLVWITPEGRSAPWPDDMRAKLMVELDKETAP